MGYETWLEFAASALTESKAEYATLRALVKAAAVLVKGIAEPAADLDDGISAVLDAYAALPPHWRQP